MAGRKNSIPKNFFPVSMVLNYIRGGGSQVSETPKRGQTRSVAVWPHCLQRRQRTVRTSMPNGLSRTFESPFAYASRGAMYLRCHSNLTSEAGAAPVDEELKAPAPADDDAPVAAKVPASFSSASSFLESAQEILLRQRRDGLN